MFCRQVPPDILVADAAGDTIQQLCNFLTVRPRLAGPEVCLLIHYRFSYRCPDLKKLNAQTGRYRIQFYTEQLKQMIGPVGRMVSAYLDRTTFAINPEIGQ